MHWYATAYFLVLIITGCTTGVLSLIAWRQRSSPGSFLFSMLLLAITEWTVAAIFEISAAQPQTKIFWSVIEYLGLVASPPLFLAVVLNFSHLDHWLTFRNLALAAILPVVTLGMAATNNMHHWLWSSFSFDPATNIMTYGHGPWFWVNATYCYLLILAATVILVWDSIRFRQPYRSQAISLLAAVAFPWAANAIYITRLGPPVGLDWTSVAFSMTGILFFLTTFRFHFLDQPPVAHEQVFDSLSEGVIVLDILERIGDLNPTAVRLLNLGSRPVIGQPAASILAAWPSFCSPRRARRKNNGYSTPVLRPRVSLTSGSRPSSTGATGSPEELCSSGT